MTDWLGTAGPAAGFMLAGIPVCAVGLCSARPRVRVTALAASVVFLGVCVYLGRFDGLRHDNHKFDTTVFVWAGAVWRRALAGLALAALAAPLGLAAGRTVGCPRRLPAIAAGLAALLPAALGLAASSLLLQARVLALRTLPAEARVASLVEGIGLSTTLLAVAATASGLVLAALAVAWLRRGRGGARQPADGSGSSIGVNGGGSSPGSTAA